MKPLAIDLYCGLGGWAEGFLAEGYRVIGFDIERHDYGMGAYPGELILRDIRSISGAELVREYGIPDVIVGSSPCQEFSYRAMPWKRAKALPPPYLGMELFQAQFRIQREASEAAGRYIPLIVENVRGAQKWVGRAQAEYGSFMLWGDIRQVGRKIVRPDYKYGDTRYLIAPAPRRLLKQPMQHFDFPEKFGIPSPSFHGCADEPKVVAAVGLKMGWDNTIRGNCRRIDGIKNPAETRDEKYRLTQPIKVPGISFRGYGSSDYKSKGFNVTAAQRFREEFKVSDRGVKGFTSNGQPLGANTLGRRFGLKSDSRKAASALIAKIPFPLAQHIARCFKPTTEAIA
jgi:hypothetical protein